MQNSVMSWNLTIKLSWWQTIRDIPDFNYVMPLIWNWTGYLLDSQYGKFALLVELYDSLQVWSFFCCVSNWNDTTLRFFKRTTFSQLMWPQNLTQIDIYSQKKIYPHKKRTFLICTKVNNNLCLFVLKKM